MDREEVDYTYEKRAKGPDCNQSAVKRYRIYKAETTG